MQRFLSNHFPYLPIHVRIGLGQIPDQEFDMESVVDTGFDSGLAVPRNIINTAVLPDTTMNFYLVDGTEILSPVYLGYIQIGDFEPVLAAIISIGDYSLLGREVTDHFRITFDHGVRLTVEP